MCCQMCTSVPSGRRVHLFFLRGQQNVHILQYSKFTEDANWNKRKWHYNQNKDLSGKWYCQTLITFRIISSEMKISLLILSWCSSCLNIQRIGMQYTDQLFWKLLFWFTKKKISYICGKINLYRWFIAILLHFHYFISLETANTQKSEVFLLRISLGNVNASVVTCRYPQIYNFSFRKEFLETLCI